jgi:hypothetical protein
VTPRPCGDGSRRSAGRGPGGLPAEGADATLGALTRSQVQVLLIVDDPDDERGAWFGATPSRSPPTGPRSRPWGESMPVQGRLPDVAVRAALGTSAPSTSSTRPPGVLGALLRFPTA